MRKYEDISSPKSKQDETSSNVTSKIIVQTAASVVAPSAFSFFKLVQFAKAIFQNEATGKEDEKIEASSNSRGYGTISKK